MTALEAKVRFLSDPASYSEPPGRIRAKETHMSWVFIADDRVLKLKKPVKRSYLDFTTVGARKFYCDEELRLNRRLAPETYRAVRPLYCSETGGLTFEPTGRVADWLVEMRRLPADEMLDARIEVQRITARDISDIADRLARFYLERSPEFADGSAYIRHLIAEQEINRATLMRCEFDLGASGVDALVAWVDAGLGEMRGLIEARIAKGGIVEGHGDLRPEHICLTTPPQIIDCLEFNRSMRIIDPYDEMNYLGLECEVLGAGWITPLLLASLAKTRGERPDDRLIGMYGGFRGLLRARLCFEHLLEHPVREPEKWRPLALAYLGVVRHRMSGLVV